MHRRKKIKPSKSKKVKQPKPATKNSLSLETYKPKFNITGKEFEAFFKNKTIAVVGNSKCVFQNKNGDMVDSHDIVIRMNCAFTHIKKYKQYVGSKTDVWSCGIGSMPSQIIGYEVFNKCKYIFWTWHDRLSISPKITNKVYPIPIEEYYKVADLFGDMRPTSGAILLSYIINNLEYKSLTVTGFDFLHTTNYFSSNKNRAVSPHSPDKEEEFITNILTNNRDINWIKSTRKNNKPIKQKTSVEKETKKQEHALINNTSIEK